MPEKTTDVSQYDSRYTVLMNVKPQRPHPGCKPTPDSCAAVNECCTCAPPPHSGSLSRIVAHYNRHYRKQAARELRCFAIQRSLWDVVSSAGLAEHFCGKRFSHQRRIPRAALAKSRRRLLRDLPKLRNARTFEELHSFIASRIKPIPGIGELTIYDTALRIGAKLHKEPKCVYLHAGTRIGARKLVRDMNREFIGVEEFPRPLRRLRPREIEDLLCIYKDHLNGGIRPWP